jgi:hypothetical protein
MPDCQDQDRRNLILKLASDATLEASQTLLEHAIQIQDSEAIEISQQLIEKALIAKNAWHTNLTWTGSAWTKTVENVLAKGTPLKVTQGLCQITDCPACFWESICSREKTEKIIQRSKDLIADMKEPVKRFASKLNMEKRL